MPRTETAPIPGTPSTELLTMQPNGLRITGQPTFEVWHTYVRRIITVNNATLWTIGDLLNYGEGRADWGETWTQVLSGTEKSEDSLMSAMNVCKKFPHDRRRLDLSFAHHREVAAFTAEQQDRYLDLAEAGQWNVKQLREHVRSDRALTDPTNVINDDGAIIASDASDDETPASGFDATRSVSVGVRVYMRTDPTVDGPPQVAILASLVFHGPVANLPRAWQQLARRYDREIEAYESGGWTLVNMHVAGRRPADRLLRLNMDPMTFGTTSAD